MLPVAGSLEAVFLRFQVTGYRQHRGCIITQAVTHSLALLKMGKIIARNMLSLLELLINCYCCIYLVVYIINVSDAQSSKYQTQISSFLKIRPVGTELFHADGRTDTMKLIVAILNFTNML